MSSEKRVIPSRRGFTLVEVMIVLALLLIFIGLAFSYIRGLSLQAERQRLMGLAEDTSKAVVSNLKSAISSAKPVVYLSETKKVLLPTPIVVPSYYAWNGNDLSKSSVCLTPTSNPNIISGANINLTINGDGDRNSWITLLANRYFDGDNPCDPDYKNLLAYVDFVQGLTLAESRLDLHLIYLQRDPNTRRISLVDTTLQVPYPQYQDIVTDVNGNGLFRRMVDTSLLGNYFIMSGGGGIFLADTYNNSSLGVTAVTKTLLNFPPEVASAVILFRYSLPVEDKLKALNLLTFRFVKGGDMDLVPGASDAFSNFLNNPLNYTCGDSVTGGPGTDLCNPSLLNMEIGLLLTKDVSLTDQDTIEDALNHLANGETDRAFMLYRYTDAISTSAELY